MPRDACVGRLKHSIYTPRSVKSKLYFDPSKRHQAQRQNRLFIYPMAQYLFTVALVCTLAALVCGRAVVDPRKQAELMVSLH